MAKCRRLNGYKHRITNPNPGPNDSVLPDGVVDWVLRHDNRVVVHQIWVMDDVMTPDGEMLLVKIRQQAELSDPNVDVAVQVGMAKAYRKNGRIDPFSPELWFYNDKFWVKAKSSDGTEYYNAQQYLFYEVVVRDEESLMQATCTGLEVVQPPPPVDQ